MRTIVAGLATVTLAAVGGLMMWRASDHLADRMAADRLLARQPVAPEVFDVSMVADLPEPARRFLTFAIAPGTPLWTVAEIEMRGRFSLGTKAEPNYMTMHARQTLAAPHGFI